MIPIPCTRVSLAPNLAAVQGIAIISTTHYLTIEKAYCLPTVMSFTISSPNATAAVTTALGRRESAYYGFALLIFRSRNSHNKSTTVNALCVARTKSVRVVRLSPLAHAVQRLRLI